jgi:hypothetical protein
MDKKLDEIMKDIEAISYEESSWVTVCCPDEVEKILKKHHIPSLDTAKLDVVMKEIQKNYDINNKDEYGDNDDYDNGYRAGLLVAKNICKEQALKSQQSGDSMPAVEEEDETNDLTVAYMLGKYDWKKSQPVEPVEQVMENKRICSRCQSIVYDDVYCKCGG